MDYTRTQIADAIFARLSAEKDRLASDFHGSAIHHCVVDDLLPPEMALAIRQEFPSSNSMTLRKSLRELKFVTAQMDRHSRLAEDAIFAFHDERIVALIAEITGVREPTADSQLYAGGLSLMGNGHFLNPHIDNSHNRLRTQYRVLNLLYYVSPEWSAERGGSLELWPNGTRDAPVTVPSLFNRLVVMHTHSTSWHSVSAIRSGEPRCCVSNYYFSPRPPRGDEDYFHITAFRGRPEQFIRDLVLRLDGGMRTLIRRIKPSGVMQTKHFYKKGQNHSSG